ncbi:hypothetical protein [Pseudomonas sp. 8 R 14]|uniref:hypothetical protein n=1 Tax=Pseudomonas sp. 8 R 14 TaxID=1844092 RepID=UPI0008124231|nr:hypothetical protein [Pseudomonas sp. 8 R 14]CRM76083.1 hypothetical protein [Pseudomonas sp. 8 R 14]
MSITGNFITTIRNSEQALELGKDMGEVAIDAILADKFGVDGALKDIPILNVAVSLYRAGNKVTAYFFAKNMLAFLLEVDKVPAAKRIEFLDKNCANEEGVENVGEVALMILDKIDHPRLATMLGRAFALLTVGEIIQHEFDIYCHAIKIMNPYILQQMKQAYQVRGMIAMDLPAANLLANYGLIRLETEGVLARVSIGIPHTLEQNSFGQKFYDRIIIGRASY